MLAVTQFSEEALARRREKAEYAAAFPGLIRDWEQAEGKAVQAVIRSGDGAVVVFADGSFLIGSPGPASSDELLRGILSARSVLSRHWTAALAELDRLIDAETRAMRLARMEKVLGAVETNMELIPELREELVKLLDGKKAQPADASH